MKYRAVAIDVDGVITKIESAWQYLHKELNLLDKAKINSQLYYSKKISYYEWAKLDVELWKGLHYNKIMEIFSKVEIRDYCKEFFSYLHEKGIKVFAISGGLTPLLKYLSEKLNFDYFVANDLIFNDFKLTGEFKINVTPTNKGKVLKRILENFKIKSKECIGIGDSEFDIPMLKVCGYKIAFNPKSEELIKIANEVIYSETFYEIYKRIKELTA